MRVLFAVLVGCNAAQPPAPVAVPTASAVIDAGVAPPVVSVAPDPPPKPEKKEEAKVFVDLQEGFSGVATTIVIEGKVVSQGPVKTNPLIGRATGVEAIPSKWPVTVVVRLQSGPEVRVSVPQEKPHVGVTFSGGHLRATVQAEPFGYD